MRPTRKLLSGKTVGVDSTTLEANAAMKSIVRRETGEDWQEYVTRLMREEGAIPEDHEPSADEMRRFDRGRKGKSVANQDWVNQHDPDAKIMKMKDGTTRLSYKAEHVVDLKRDVIVAAEVRPATDADTQTLSDSVMKAQENLSAIGHEQRIDEVVADKGYHSADSLELGQHLNYRTYVPEPKRKGNWDWSERTSDHERAVMNNRKRMKREKGKSLQRARSELCERSFAHVCESGGMRRTWLRGVMETTKRYLMAAAAHNLGRVLLKLFGVGKPRSLQGFGDVFSAYSRVLAALLSLHHRWQSMQRHTCPDRPRLPASAS